MASGKPANAKPARVIDLSLGGSGGCGLTDRNAINAVRARRGGGGRGLRQHAAAPRAVIPAKARCCPGKT